jgi:hypothetical protein
MSFLNTKVVEDRQAYTRREVSEMLGVSEALIIKLDWNSKLRTIHIGRRKLVPKSEIERVLREGVWV